MSPVGAVFQLRPTSHVRNSISNMAGHGVKISVGIATIARTTPLLESEITLAFS